MECRRCASREPYITLDKVHLECRSCFLESCIKKFRSTIGRSQVLRNNDSVLLSYSGGPSSSALLELVKSSITSDLRREQKLIPSILHVDTQSVLEPDKHPSEFMGVRRQNLDSLLTNLRAAYPAWPIYWTTLETCMIAEPKQAILARYIDNCDEGAHLLSNDDAHMALRQSMSESGDTTDRQQFIADTNKEFITRVADEINRTIVEPEAKIKFILMGSSSTQLANDLMVDVILGRGALIRSRVSVCDKSYPVPILRPMREFTKKEIAYYLRARNLDPPTQPNLLTLSDRKSSIQRATEAFLAKLNIDYPATYNTLLKTGNKMKD